MEKTVLCDFEGMNAKLTKKERKGRIDIKYMTFAGIHNIIELRRLNVHTKSMPLLNQVKKYTDALIKCLNRMRKN